MSSDRNYKWSGFILNILAEEDTKISLSLMENSNVISLKAGTEKVELISDSSEKVGVIIQGSYQTKVSGEKIVNEIIDSIGRRGLMTSGEAENVLSGKENLFGALVKLATALKKNRQVQTVKNSKLGVGI